MKKLSLKSLKIEASDLLNRQALKTVFGGYNGQCKALSVPCSCTGSDGSVTVGCSSTGNCANFC